MPVEEFEKFDIPAIQVGLVFGLQDYTAWGNLSAFCDAATQATNEGGVEDVDDGVMALTTSKVRVGGGGLKCTLICLHVLL